MPVSSFSSRTAAASWLPPVGDLTVWPMLEAHAMDDKTHAPYRRGYLFEKRASSWRRGGGSVLNHP